MRPDHEIFFGMDDEGRARNQQRIEALRAERVLKSEAERATQERPFCLCAHSPLAAHCLCACSV
eukprot:6177723-Pleurochrysis_carterae.AAC.2